MSAHDYMSRSGYAEDAYPDHVEKFPVVDAEGRRWSVNSCGRSLGTSTYVDSPYIPKKTACISQKTAYISKFPVKESGHFDGGGRPRGVHDFPTKILTEVNGPPRKTSDPSLGTNQGEYNFPHEPPARTSLGTSTYVDSPCIPKKTAYISQKTANISKFPVEESGHFDGGDPNWGRGRYFFSVKEEIRDNYGNGHRYGSSLAKAEPTMGYGYDNEYNSSPRKSERAPNHQWGQSSSPVYDHQPQGGYGVPNHQGGGYGLNSEEEAPTSSSPIYSHPPEGAAAVAGKSSAPAAGFSGFRKFPDPPPVGPVRDSMVGPRDIDSKEAVRRYGRRS